MNNIEDFIKAIPLSRSCEIVNYHECGLIAINKKAGRATHPNANPSANAKPAMLRAKYNFKEECYVWETEDKQKLRLYLINRLDSPTSGVVLACSNKEVAMLAKEAFKNKTVKKTYIAITIGRPIKDGTWTDRLQPQRTNNFVRTQANNKGFVAITDYKFIKSDLSRAGLFLLEFQPKTGLTHQLRVQSAKHKFPILGDATYGDFNVNKRVRSSTKINRLFLHCKKTALELAYNGEKISFLAEAQMPESFSTILEYNSKLANAFRFIKNLDL